MITGIKKQVLFSRSVYSYRVMSLVSGNSTSHGIPRFDGTKYALWRMKFDGYVMGLDDLGSTLLDQVAPQEERDKDLKFNMV